MSETLKACPRCGQQTGKYCDGNGVITGDNFGWFVTCSDDNCMSFGEFTTVVYWNKANDILRSKEKTIKGQATKIAELTAQHEQEIKWHNEQAEKVKEQAARIAELEQLISLQHTRTVEADKRYQAAKGVDYLPDLGELVDWLMEQAQTWIPVSEPPEIGELGSDWVLVDWMYQTETLGGWRVAEEAYIRDSAWHTRDGREIAVGDEHAPTKWMPIPKA